MVAAAGVLLLAGCSAPPEPAVPSPVAVTSSPAVPSAAPDVIAEGLSGAVAAEVCEAELRSIHRDIWPEGVEVALVRQVITADDMWRVEFTAASQPDQRSWCIVRGSDDDPRFWGFASNG